MSSIQHDTPVVCSATSVSSSNVPNSETTRDSENSIHVDIYDANRESRRRRCCITTPAVTTCPPVSRSCISITPCVPAAGGVGIDGTQPYPIGTQPYPIGTQPYPIGGGAVGGVGGPAGQIRCQVPVGTSINCDGSTGPSREAATRSHHCPDIEVDVAHAPDTINVDVPIQVPSERDDVYLPNVVVSGSGRSQVNVVPTISIDPPGVNIIPGQVEDRRPDGGLNVNMQTPRIAVNNLAGTSATLPQ